jgi:hypothetical protein
LDVHQDQIVGSCLPLQRHLTILGGIHRQADAVQQFQRHFTVDRVVFRQQQTRASPMLAQLGFSTVAVSLRQRHDAVTALQSRTREPEGAALARFAFHADFAAHHLRQVARDRQPETGAAELAGGRHIGLLEGLEQAWNLVSRDADAGIFHFEPDAQRSSCSSSNFARRLMALRRELDGIAGAVEHRLTQPGLRRRAATAARCRHRR